MAAEFTKIRNENIWRRRAYRVAIAIKERFSSPSDVVLDVCPQIDTIASSIPVAYHKAGMKSVAAGTAFDGIEEGKKVTAVFCSNMGKFKSLAGTVESMARNAERFIFCSSGDRIPAEELSATLTGLGFIMTCRELGADPTSTCLYIFEKADQYSIGSNYYCTGCGSCRNACPKDAITMAYDGDGFLKPVVNRRACVSCGKCVKACPVIDPDYSNSNPECYAFAADGGKIEGSSSGGAFFRLAEKAVSEGGKVYGAVWNPDFTVSIGSAEDMPGVEPMRHSKYVQSSTELSFREVREDLESGRKVLYTGLPCQIAGLKRYLGKGYPNLVLVDLLCYYTPPQTALLKYLDENFGLDNVESITFRTVKGESGKHTVRLKDGTSELRTPNNDAYSKAFRNCMLAKDSCKHCRFARIPRQGDITIGDFWGLAKKKPEWKGKGPSIVLLNSERGKAFFESCMKDSDLREAIPNFSPEGNRIAKDASYEPSTYKSGHALLKEHGFNGAVAHLCDSKADVCIVGMYNRNYGNCLTYYSLYRAIKGTGRTVLMISNRSSNTFGGFLNYPYNIADVDPGIESMDELPKFNARCRTFVLGSDQWLRDNILVGNRYYPCMFWVDDDKYKIGCAVSFGKGSFTENRDVRTKAGTFLSRFNRISCREDGGVEVMKEAFGIESTHVLDPVFLMSADEYREMASNTRSRVPKGSYVCSYILDPTIERRDFVEEARRRIGAESTCAMYDALRKKANVPAELRDGATWDPTVEEWLAHIDGCDLLITDSFHGLCFAIILGKQFLAVYETWQWRGLSRVASLLRMFGLEDRLVDPHDPESALKALENPIDYKAVRKILTRERKKTQKWLTDSLDAADKSNLGNDGFSYFRDRCRGVEKRCDDLQGKIDALASLVMSGDIGTELYGRLKGAKDMTEYLESLGTVSLDAIVMLSVSDEASAHWDAVKFPEFLGEVPETIPYRSGFAMVSDLSAGISSSEVGKAVSAELTAGELAFRAGSFGYESPESQGHSEFTVGEETISVPQRGLNVAVYSKAKGKIMDIVSADLYAGPAGTLIWKRCRACASRGQSFNWLQAIAKPMTVIEIRIELKKGVADPEGKNTWKALESLGFEGISGVKSVKLFEVDLDMPADRAVAAGEEMCRKLLANPVVQSYKVTVR
ncbi:MAG: phosphoribosylformylglycinamidine synthase subunit PurS [Candidatus Methanomethylophilaceae archaeon]|nr:phosphoribosylformylglycinamidine synthase subunit PurS [Candidatus Methanomethylophilaceae archaeon]